MDTGLKSSDLGPFAFAALNIGVENDNQNPFTPNPNEYVLVDSERTYHDSLTVILANIVVAPFGTLATETVFPVTKNAAEKSG